MYIFLSLLLVILLIMYICIIFLKRVEEPLHKYYHIIDNNVYAKMDIPEFTDLGVISVHTQGGIDRTNKYDNGNVINKTKSGIPWRKHRDLGTFLKHSETPNCEVYKSSPMTFGLRTMKKIQDGDQISSDFYPLQHFYQSKV